MIGLKNARTRIFARIEAISVLTFARKRRGKLDSCRLHCPVSENDWESREWPGTRLHIGGKKEKKIGERNELSGSLGRERVAEPGDLPLMPPIG